MTNPLVLIIEDDPQINQVFMLALSDTFEVESVTDGAQALVRLSEDNIPHLIILDVNLPGASGAKILQIIRADSRFSATRIILATADSRKADELQDKADIVLLKPISVMQLRELANRLK